MNHLPSIFSPFALSSYPSFFIRFSGFSLPIRKGTIVEDVVDLLEG